MNAHEIIIKKRDQKALTKAEIVYFVDEYLKGNIEEYQMSALLMAILLNGMNYQETYWLTESYINSGNTIDFGKTNGKYIDKHSTGGVGDKVSIILAPLVAACGVYDPMISGRGLGHTGGTLDKLESIPGFKTNVKKEEFKNLVAKNGFAIISQTEDLVPADHRIYAVRDVTGTVESIPLITASIMSKKIASGIDGLVIDLKVGAGAFMQKLEHGKNLAKFLKKVGEEFGKKVKVVFTYMDAPLGYTVGNGIEIIESIEFLKGNYQKDLKEVVFALAKQMLIMANLTDSEKKATEMLQKALDSGGALEKFKNFVKLQNGDINIIDDYSLLVSPKSEIEIKASEGGYVKKINSREIGWALIDVNAGRKVITDSLHHSAGLEIYKKIGDKVKKGTTLATLYFSNDKGEETAKRIQKAFEISSSKPKGHSRIIDII
ncbi:MAG: thymidine phosphorylase [Candidatus Cloacimonetes bacterium]|nr:thymidine phosphorylase [Candidatus Cloacimonadota bacterium]MBS3766521.1 thymidine phosphorylase [Candidatus Cloacimonadota bacterium]